MKCVKGFGITFLQHMNQRKSELKATHFLHNQFNPFLANVPILNPLKHQKSLG